MIGTVAHFLHRCLAIIVISALLWSLYGCQSLDNGIHELSEQPATIYAETESSQSLETGTNKTVKEVLYDIIFSAIRGKGYAGTEKELLEAIKKDTQTSSQDFSSSYQVAVNKGFLGTSQEWIKIINKLPLNNEPSVSSSQSATENGQTVASRDTSTSNAVSISTPSMQGTTKVNSLPTSTTTCPNITETESVTAPDHIINVFRVVEIGRSGNEVTVEISLDGDVSLCGFDLKLFYDPAVLQLTSYNAKQDMSIVANSKQEAGVILFSLALAENWTDTAKILTATFRIKNCSSKQTLIRLEAANVFAINEHYEPVSTLYELHNSTVSLL